MKHRVWIARAQGAAREMLLVLGAAAKEPSSIDMRVQKTIR